MRKITAFVLALVLVFSCAVFCTAGANEEDSSTIGKLLMEKGKITTKEIEDSSTFTVEDRTYDKLSVQALTITDIKSGSAVNGVCLLFTSKTYNYPLRWMLDLDEIGDIISAVEYATEHDISTVYMSRSGIEIYCTSSRVSFNKDGYSFPFLPNEILASFKSVQDYFAQ